MNVKVSRTLLTCPLRYALAGAIWTLRLADGSGTCRLAFGGRKCNA